MLSSRLTTQKEHLLEKELILEEVTSLTDKLRLQAAEGHEITLALAKKMNELQYRVKKVTRKMMAVVSELSMYQATALKLENEKKELQNKVQTGEQLMKEGEAPFIEAQMEWDRIIRDRTFQEREMARGINHRDWTPDNQNDMQNDNSKIQTTAEPRPNAYIADDIGIPKPYGAHAPFKPSQLGANMRHIRKPNPIEVII